jgi:hypothetical protein
MLRRHCPLRRPSFASTIETAHANTPIDFDIAAADCLAKAMAPPPA